MNKQTLEKRVIAAGELTLHQQQYVSSIDILTGIGYLHPVHVHEWQKGQIPCLESVIQSSLKKISFAMKCFRKWAQDKGLNPRETVYKRRTKGGKLRLRFSVSGNPTIEQLYSTHYVSPILKEEKVKRLQEKWEKSPDLVVFSIITSSECTQCSTKLHKGRFLFMDEGNPLCLSCAGLNELAYLPSGNANLTRWAKKNSSKSAVVVRFSRARKRYERQGTLVEEKALQEAQKRYQN